MEEPETRPNLQSVGYDDLLEDVFGLNIRGLKSLWISVIKPKNYYEAAHHADWQGKFTPAFRLWFSIVALTFFFQFFWASSDSGIIDYYTAVMEQQKIPLPENLSTRTAAITFSRWYFGLLPFVYAVLYFLIASLFVFFGRKLPFVIRQRYVFITNIPVMLFTFGIYILMAIVPDKYSMTLLVFSGIPVLLIVWVTAFRGAFTGCSLYGRIWRSMALTLALLTATIIAGVIAQILAVIGIDQYYQ